MLIGTVTFDCASSIELTRRPDGYPILHTPHRRFDNRRGLALHQHGRGPFSNLILQKLPSEPGVYAIVNDASRVLYIGKSDSVAERWGSTGYRVISPRNCFVGGQSTSCRINGTIVRAILNGVSLY